MEPQFIKVCTLQELDQKDFVNKDIMGRSIAIIKLEDGGLHAVESRCKHQGANLLEGLSDRLETMEVECPRHKWRYNLLTGECLSNLSPGLKIFPIEVRGLDVFVGFSFDQF